MKKFIALMAIIASTSVFARYFQDDDYIVVDQVQYDKQCATIYSGHYGDGYALNLTDGARVRDLRAYRMNGFYYENWDNKVSSIRVAPRCTLIGYQYRQFGTHETYGYKFGWAVRYSNRSYNTARIIQEVPYRNNRISSLKCYCDRF